MQQRPQLKKLLPGQVLIVGAGHVQDQLIQCEARARRLNGWSWEVGVSLPKPFVYTSLAETREKGEVV